MYIDPYLANNMSQHSSHNSSIDYTDREKELEDEVITPSTRSRFNIPNFPSSSNDRGNSESRDRHRFQHPRGPRELDQQESMRLVSDDEGEYEGGVELHAQESRDQL